MWIYLKVASLKILFKALSLSGKVTSDRLLRRQPEEVRRFWRVVSLVHEPCRHRRRRRRDRHNQNRKTLSRLETTTTTAMAWIRIIMLTALAASSNVVGEFNLHFILKLVCFQVFGRTSTAEEQMPHDLEVMGSKSAGFSFSPSFY